MTGLEGNSEFCFPETLNVPRGQAEWNIEVSGKQNSLFPAGPVIKCLVLPPNSKIESLAKKSFAWDLLDHKFATVSRSTTWSRARRSCFPWGLVSFVHPREL